MGNDWLGGLAELAAAQDGVLSARQAAALGVDRRRLTRAVSRGVLARRHPQVFAFAAAPCTDRQRIRAAVLQVPDSVASHESALLLGGVERVPLVAAVTIPPARHHHCDGIRVHRSGDLLAEHTTIVDGITTTTLERAVVDLASVFLPARLDAVVDHLTITRRRTSIGAISRVLRQVDHRGRFRIGVLEALLDVRRPSEPAPRSTLERRVDELIDLASLPAPTKEHPLPAAGGEHGYVDRAWVEALLIVEIDGRTWHARERAMAKDRARDRQAARAGWLTLRILDEEVRDCPDAVVDDLVSTYRKRILQLGRAA